jgi:hypothetical protein
MHICCAARCALSGAPGTGSRLRTDHLAWLAGALRARAELGNTAWFARADMNWEGTQPAPYRSSPIALRIHCGRCGTPPSLAYDAPRDIAFAAGTLDAPSLWHRKQTLLGRYGTGPAGKADLRNLVMAEEAGGSRSPSIRGARRRMCRAPFGHRG